MTQNTSKVTQNSNDKSQWVSPEVWDLSVGRTQGGPAVNLTEGQQTTIIGVGTFVGRGAS